MMPSAQSYTTPERQAVILQDRGLKITDAARAADYLRRIGYYRLSGYCKPFQAAGSERFVSGASFEDVVALYIFDKRLRLAMMDMLERIEVAVRAAVADRMGAKDPYAHLDIIDHRGEANEASSPIWVKVETWSFGALSKFYALMRPDDQRAVAARFGVARGGDLQSWLKAMSFARNVAAHHGRLWNRGIVSRPKLPGDITGFDPPLDDGGGKPASRIYAVLCVAVFLSRRICPRSEWPRRLRRLVAEDFPAAPGRSLREMGFPPEWKSGDFWNR